MNEATYMNMSKTVKWTQNQNIKLTWSSLLRWMKEEDLSSSPPKVDPFLCNSSHSFAVLILYTKSLIFCDTQSPHSPVLFFPLHNSITWINLSKLQNSPAVAQSFSKLKIVHNSKTTHDKLVLNIFDGILFLVKKKTILLF
jgi:hypothetical protein